MQIIFCKPNSVIGSLIQWFTKISWVGECRAIHVAIRYGRSESRWLVEADKKGFCPNWWNSFVKKSKIQSQYDVLGIDEDRLESIVDSQLDEYIDEGYDYGNVFGFAIIVLLYKITGKKFKNIFSWTNHLACSEVTYKIFQEVTRQTGIDYFGKHDPSCIFPEELLEECESRPRLFKRYVEEIY